MKKLLLTLIFITSLGVNSQTLDTTFGTTGVVTNQFTDIYSLDVCYAAAIQPDGKIIYVGRSSTEGYGFIIRRNSNGTTDTTFNSYGYRKLSINGFECVAIQTDGKILVAGLNVVYRLNSNGSLDTTFNSNGLFIPSVSTASFFTKSIIPQTNGKILIAGYANTGNSNDFAVIRINSNGTYDTTFDTDGKATYAIGNGADECYAMAVQTDGKLILVGQTNNGTNYDIATLRINSDGTNDISFGSNGKVINQFGINKYGRAIDIQADGKIVVMGSNNVIRMNTNGALDTTFDGDGNYNITNSLSFSTSTTNLTLNRPRIKSLSSGKILISATVSSDFGLIQLNSNGSLDTTFGTNGVATLNGSSDTSNILLIRSDGKIVTGGTNFNSTSGTSQIQYILFGNTGIFESEARYNLDYGKDNADRTIEQSTGKTVVLNLSRGSQSLKRFNVDGSVDNSFGSFGVDLTGIDPYKMLNINDKILLTDNNGVKLHKFNSNGSYDTTFGINGILDFSLNAPNYIQFIDEVFYNPADGYTYVGFDYDESLDNAANTYTSFGISRITANGSFDSTFGVNGIAKVRFDYFGTGTYEWPAEITIQSTGKIVVSGVVLTTLGNNSDTKAIGILRLNNNGTLDTTFGTAGKVVTQINSRDYPIGIRLLSNDKFLLNASDYIVSNATNITFSVQYNSNGSLDTTFGTNGMVNDSNYFKTMVVQPDGKIIKGGSYNSQFNIVRYNTNGTLDTTFGTAGYVSTTINNYSAIENLLMLANGKLLAGGYSYNGQSLIMTQARYTSLTLGTLSLNSTKNSLLVYPNPIENQATFEYNLKNETSISIDIVDMQGKTIKTILSNQNQIEGNYKQNIDLSDVVTSGNYFIRFSSPTGNQAVQIIKK